MKKFVPTFFIIFFLSSCGVKGPPLPPIPSTPQKSDPVKDPSPQPSQTPHSR